MAYNEEGNIGKLLDALVNQELEKIKISEIIIVASGCTDRTEKVVRNKIRQHPLIKLITQKTRQGKARAINLFIKKAGSQILVMISADILPCKTTIERVVEPFEDIRVGVSAGQVIPQNNRNTFMGFYTHTFWKLHHEIAKRYFKAGELVAWRNVFKEIDPETSTDETNIVALILKKGLKAKYVAQAKVFNRGPETVADFLRVRRRHLAAYYHLKEVMGLDYLPPTLNNKLVLKLLFKTIKPQNLKEWFFLLGVVGLEGLGKILAWYDWKIKKESHTIWQIAPSTKTLT